MDLKTTTIGAITLALGIVGTLGISNLGDDVDEPRSYEEVKLEACDGKYVQYEDGDNYYCATLEQMGSDWTREEDKFKKNETTKEDYVYLDLVAKNDEVKRKDLEADLVAKYDTKEKKFDSTKMGSDFNFQLQFAVELATLECGEDCTLEGDTMDERIYNLIK